MKNTSENQTQNKQITNTFLKTVSAYANYGKGGNTFWSR